MSSKYLPAWTVGVFLVYDLLTSDKTSNLWVNILLSFFVSFFCTNGTKIKKDYYVCIYFKVNKKNSKQPHEKWFTWWTEWLKNRTVLEKTDCWTIKTSLGVDVTN